MNLSFLYPKHERWYWKYIRWSQLPTPERRLYYIFRCGQCNPKLTRLAFNPDEPLVVFENLIQLRLETFYYTVDNEKKTVFYYFGVCDRCCTILWTVEHFEWVMGLSSSQLRIVADNLRDNGK